MQGSAEYFDKVKNKRDDRRTAHPLCLQSPGAASFIDESDKT